MSEGLARKYKETMKIITAGLPRKPKNVKSWKANKNKITGRTERKDLES